MLWGLIFLFLVILFSLFVNSYRPFRLDYDPLDPALENRCILYYEQCTCFGLLNVMESYPPQFHCSGIKTCSPLDEVSCN